MTAAAPLSNVTHPWLKGDHLPLTIMMLIGIAIMVLSQVGYYLGWWNDFHTPAFLVGLAVTALAAVGNYLLGATGREVRGTGGEVRAMRSELRGVGHEVRDVGQEVRKVGQKMDVQTGVLQDIRDRLPPTG